MKTIYRYDSEFKFFTHEDILYPLKSDPGEYIFPPNSTEIEPPRCGDCCIAIFDEIDNVWTVMVDNRGTYYNTDTKEIINVNDPCFCIDGYTNITPLQESHPSECIVWNGQQWICEKIEEEYNFDTTNMSFEDKLNRILKTNSRELFDKVLEQHSINYRGFDGLMSSYNIGPDEVLDYIGLGRDEHSIGKWNLHFGSFAEFTYEYNNSYALDEILHNLRIDPYELKELLNNLPPKPIETDTATE